MDRAPPLSRDERQAEIQRLRRQYGYSALPHDIGVRLMDLPEPQSASGEMPYPAGVAANETATA